MSTTAKYNFLFIIPNSLTTFPIPFTQFCKGIDEQGNQLGFYSYDELMTQPGRKAFTTPSGTHKLLSINITSIFDLATKFPAYISQISPTTIIVEGVDIAKWEDVVQDDYLWIVPTEPNLEYNFDNFKKVSPLYIGAVDEGLL